MSDRQGRESPRRRILVVDDDDLFRESLEQNLVDAAFDVVTFSDGPAILEYIDSRDDGDLILLDWKMPEMNGIEVLRRLRQVNCQLPVIFLTVLSDQIFEEAALTGGAVDFIEKSRSFTILLRRIELTLDGKISSSGAAPPTSHTQIVRQGDLELTLASHRASWKGQTIKLSHTEFQIVLHLAAKAGTDVRYREIYDLVHGENFVAGFGDEGYRANVRTFIRRIRQKFKNVDESFEEIENYPGFGYRWRGEDSGEKRN